MMLASDGLAIEGSNRDRREVDVRHASKIDGGDGVAFRIRAFAKHMDSAGRAEPMLDDMLVEQVGARRFVQSLQSEAGARDEPQERGSSGADGTVAGQPAIDGAFDFDGDIAAVAACGMGGAHDARGWVQRMTLL